MEEFITLFKDTGPCEVDVAKVVAAWTNAFSISQHKDEYRLIEQLMMYEEECFKVTISKEQALEIIANLKLLPIKSSFFRNATTWRTESNILSETKRLEKLLPDTTGEIRSVLLEALSEFNEALKHR